MADMQDMTMQEMTCPICGMVNNQVTGRESPQPGMAIICMGCEGVAIITETGCRPAGPYELTLIQDDPRFAEYIQALRVYKFIASRSATEDEGRADDDESS